jgi:hypothetical protein
MKTLRAITIVITILYIPVSCTLSHRESHSIFFLTEVCIKPYKMYDYLTCDTLKVSIDGVIYYVPKNFKTNLASIPRVLWSLIPPQFTSFVAPAILHDFLYNCPGNLNRRYADEVLYSALRAEGVSPLTAVKFYLAVRWFGAINFQGGRDCNGRAGSEDIRP